MKNLNRNKKGWFLLLLVFIFWLPASAQKDTARKPAVVITSSFKPVLRTAYKINFSASHLPTDTTRARLTYNIPSQNLVYSYMPVVSKPLALAIDTALYLGTRRYLKAGAGNFATPYLEAGFSFGDGKTSLVNFYGNYISSKGEIKNQDYSQLRVLATGSYFMDKNELYGSAGVKNDNYYLYGYDHKLYDFDKADIRQQFEVITAKAGIRNFAVNKLRINYNPNAEVDFFTNRNKVSETTVTVNIPIEKMAGENLSFKLDFKGAFTNYQRQTTGQDKISLRNNLIQLAPSVKYARPLFNVQVGVIPVWNQGNYEILPNISFEAQLQDKPFLVQGGWIGRYTKNTYHYLTDLNPYLSPITSLLNTRELELYGGIKAGLGKHLNVNAKASLLSYKDVPIFINDTATDSKAFIISNEPTMNNFRIHADANFISQDKFTLSAGFNINGYTGLNVNKKAWHTLPLEVTGSFRWLAFEKLTLKSDLYIFEGGNALGKGNAALPLEGGFDLSAGAEYQINKQFSAWVSLNNILNDKYQRWNNYRVYGTNFLGGILIKF